MSLVSFYNTNLIPLLYLQFFLFILLLSLNFKRIANEFKGLDKRYFLCVFIIMVALLSVYFTHLDKLPFERFFILSVARSFSEGKTNLFFLDEKSPSGIMEPRDPYPYGPFHPFMLGLFYKLLGPSTDLAYTFYAGVAALSVIVFFLLGYHLFQNENIGMFVSISYLLVYLAGFFNSFISEQADFLILFVSLSLLFMFISYKINKTSMYALTLLTILLTMQIRFEIAVLFPVFLVGIFLYRFSEAKSIRFWLGKLLPGLLVLILLSPLFFIHASSHHFYQTSDNIMDRFLAPMHLFSGKSFTRPDDIWLFFEGFVYFWTRSMPIVFSVLAVTGIVLCFKYNGRAAFLLLLLFVLNNMVFLLWNNGCHMRYALATATPFMIFLGFGASFIPSLLRSRWRELSMAGIFIIMIAAFGAHYGNRILSLSFEKSLSTENFEKELKPFLEKIGDEDANLVVLGDERFQNTVEFITVKKTANFIFYLSDYYLPIEVNRVLNEAGYTYRDMFDYWRLESDTELVDQMNKAHDRAVVAIRERIANNETLRESIKKIFLRNGTYFLAQNYDTEDKVYNVSLYLAKNVFGLEPIYSGSLIMIYAAKA